MSKVLQLGDLPKQDKVPKQNIKSKVIDMTDVKSVKKTWGFFDRLGWIDGNTCENRPYAGINGMWKDKPCYVIGAGPSLKYFLDEVGFEWLKDRHTIGINHIVEDFDDLEILFFMDKQFIDITTYNIHDFKGRIFAGNKTSLDHKNNITIFKTVADRPREKIEQGLFSPNFSGLAALNLAIITGANPIYLLGFGGGGSGKSYHYKKDYTGEVKEDKRFNNFKRVLNEKKHFGSFQKYKNRIVHVTEANDIKFLNKMRIEEFKTIHGTEKPLLKITQEARIAHFSFTDDIQKHGDITRNIIDNCVGKHKLYSIHDEIPEADLYVIEHFLSTDQFSRTFPHKNRAIDLVHTVNCIPARGYNTVVAITQSWIKWLNRKGIKNVKYVPGGIDLKPYSKIQRPNKNKTFGRITRWSPGKIHPETNRIIREILETVSKSKCLMYTDFVSMKDRSKLEHENMVYDESAKIHEYKGQYLKNLSVYFHANNYFKETMSIALVEALATGLPIVYLKEKTGVISEVVGDAGIPCDNINQVREGIVKLLLDKDMRQEYFYRAKRQSYKWAMKNTVDAFNSIIKERLR